MHTYCMCTGISYTLFESVVQPDMYSLEPGRDCQVQRVAAPALRI